ncbi:hypothetical protein F4703DRAFT_1849135 [Phycomyces blakesleeanus]
MLIMAEENKLFDVIVGIDFGTTFSGFSCEVIPEKKEPPKPETANTTKAKKKGNYAPELLLKKTSSAMYFKKDEKKIFEFGDKAEKANEDYKYPETKTEPKTEPKTEITTGTEAHTNSNVEPDVANNTEDKTESNPGDLVRRTKLLLDRTIKNHPDLPARLTLVHAVSRYLKKIRRNIHIEIETKYGHDPKLLKYKYYITVPASWSKQSRNIMRDAAISSKLVEKHNVDTQLEIIDEPVAAAVYAESKNTDIKFKKGDRYMICDAGGETVNLAVFEKDTIEGQKSLKEITFGAVTPSVSSLLDALFEELLEKRLPEWSEKGTSQPEDTQASTEVDGQKIKKYKPRDHVLNIYHMTLKENIGQDSIDIIENSLEKINEIIKATHKDIENNPKIFTPEEIRTEMFYPVVEIILKTIKKQIEIQKGIQRTEQDNQPDERKLKAIFITGGLGQSKYLQDKIKEKFGEEVEDNNIIGVEEGIMAVMKGAVLIHSNPIEISQKIHRRTYGIRLRPPQKKPPGSNGKIDRSNSLIESEKNVEENDYENDKKEKEKNRFHVYIRKNDPVIDNTWITKKMYWKAETLKVISLCAYNGDGEPPTHPKEEDIDTVITLDTGFSINKKDNSSSLEILILKMSFDIDIIDIKGSISNLEFKYPRVEDLTGEKNTLPFIEINPAPFSKFQKIFPFLRRTSNA